MSITFTRSGRKAFAEGAHLRVGTGAPFKVAWALARDDTLRSQANGDHGLKPMLLGANEIKTDDPRLLGAMTKVTRNDSCTKSHMRPR